MVYLCYVGLKAETPFGTSGQIGQKLNEALGSQAGSFLIGGVQLLAKLARSKDFKKEKL
jgi:hypothetical protein